MEQLTWQNGHKMVRKKRQQCFKQNERLDIKLDF